MRQTKIQIITINVDKKRRRFYLKDEIYVLPDKTTREELGIHIWLPLSYYLNGKWKNERIKVEEV